MTMTHRRTMRLKRAAPALADRWAVIGKVRRTVGLQGWLRIGLNTDYPERFKPGSRVLIQQLSGDGDNEPETALIENWRAHHSGDAIEVKFAGIDDCDAAAHFVNGLLVIAKEERELLTDESEFYPDELAGMQVIGPDDKPAGTVLTLTSEAACPYLTIKADDGTEVMIPFMKIFIGSVSRAARQIKLTEPLAYHIPVE